MTETELTMFPGMTVNRNLLSKVLDLEGWDILEHGDQEELKAQAKEMMTDCLTAIVEKGIEQKLIEKLTDCIGYIFEDSIRIDIEKSGLVIAIVHPGYEHSISIKYDWIYLLTGSSEEDVISNHEDGETENAIETLTAISENVLSLAERLRISMIADGNE